MTEKSNIPVLDLSAEIQSLWEPLNDAIQRVLRSGQFILGPEVDAFEREAAEFLSVKHAVSCNSGTDALLIALRAMGIGDGDEVITTPFSFVATAEAVRLAGAKPKFVDIDPDTLNIDAALIEAAITPRTRAILPVHLFGHAADMQPILEIARSRNLLVLEDVAQAMGGDYLGRPLGALGKAGAFSFFPTKNLGAFGDGGLISTDDDEVAHKSRMLRVHGSSRRYHHDMIGYTSRLDAIQAAILRVKLPYLRAWNDGRRAAAERYRQQLGDISWLRLPHEEHYCRHVFHQYTVRVLDRDPEAVQQHLAQCGIATMRYYPVPIHRMAVYADQPAVLPHAEEAARRVLSLPIGAALSDETIGRVSEALHSL